MMNRNIGSIGECKDLIARFETNEFYVGEEIECLIHTRDKSNMYVPGNVDKNISSSFWVGVQTHGHVTIGHEILVDKAIKLPKVYRKLNDISVQNCGTMSDVPENMPHFVNYTGKRGYCILYGTPMFEEFKIKPSDGRDVVVKYTLKLPNLMPPSFLGKLVKYTYFVTFSICEDTINNPEKVKNYHIPIQIHFIPQEPPKSLIDKHGFFSITGADIIDTIRNHDFEGKMNRNFQDEKPRYDPRNDIEAFGNGDLFSIHPKNVSNKAQFNVTYENKQVASVQIVQDVQGPYGMIQIMIEFDRETYICDAILVELQFIEYLLNFYGKKSSTENAPNTATTTTTNTTTTTTANYNNIKTNIHHTSTVDEYECKTLYKENLFFDLQIPFYGLTFSTDLIDVQWLLKFKLNLKLKKELVDLNKKNTRNSAVLIHQPNENVKENVCELHFPLKNYA